MANAKPARRRASGSNGSSDKGKLYDLIGELSSRVTTLEAQRPHIDAMLTDIKQSIGEIKGNMSKVVWVVIVAVIGALLQLVLRGQ